MSHAIAPNYRCLTCGAATTEFDPRCPMCGERLPCWQQQEGELRSGERVGRFEVVERLGRGGMCTVYRVHDPELSRDVALKILRAEGAWERQRFEREGRAAAALDHPSLGVVHDCGTYRGRPFLVLAFHAGETLAERLARGRLPWPEAVAIARALADGLTAVHGAGLVHRDLKPSNVILTRGGGVKLIDFGVAWHPELPRLTAEGCVVGTVAYMAPEQLRGEVVDGRSDLWSLGVILHEMLTGALPFAGEGASRLAAILHGPPAARLVGRALPVPIVELVKRCLEKNPACRPPSAGQVAADLAAVLAGGLRPRRRPVGAKAEKRGRKGGSGRSGLSGNAS